MIKMVCDRCGRIGTRNSCFPSITLPIKRAEIDLCCECKKAYEDMRVKLYEQENEAVEEWLTTRVSQCSS